MPKVRIDLRALSRTSWYPENPFLMNDSEVWYSESSMNPNTVVHFDPKSERFS